LQAIILAGGKGTRLKTAVKDVPKPLAPINGTPFLAVQLRNLKEFGVQKIILSVGYQYEKIVSYFGDHFEGLKIEYAIENEPLGTGGAIKHALLKVDSLKPAFVLNGDTFSELDYRKMYKNFIGSQKDFGIAVTEVKDIARYGAVKLSEDNSEVIGFVEKKNAIGSGLINSGVYLMRKDFFKGRDLGKTFSFESDCLYSSISTISTMPFIYQGLFIDIGIPSDYELAQTLLLKY